MAVVNSHYGYCAAGGAVSKFTYTGTYNVRKDGVVELLTSGTLVFLEPKVIDVFMVGGGGSGGLAPGGAGGFGGGGGGYTRTLRQVNVSANTQINVTVGAGGVAGDGGSSAFNTITVKGGTHNNGTAGASGGSGGGGGVSNNSKYGTGGADGQNGESGYPTTTSGGIGQKNTTREFGESTGKLYSGGGGGGRIMSAQSPVVSNGGGGGGGTGGWVAPAISGNHQPPAAGVANTGGGGGGGARYDEATNKVNGASGGSGIVCFREAQELPELAGTWVLNERLYAAPTKINETVNFTARKTADSAAQQYANFYSDTQLLFTRATGSTSTIYTYSTNAWGEKYKYLIFPAGATASNELRAWLASNAVKQ